MPQAKKSKKDSDESKSEGQSKKEPDKEPDKESDEELEPTVQVAPPSPPVRDVVTPEEDPPKRRPVELAAPSQASVISYTAPQSKPG